MPFVYRKQAAIREGNPLLNPQSIPQSFPPLALQQQQQQQPSSSPSQQQALYPENILRKIEAAQKYDCDYIPTKDDIKEIEFEKYKQVFKDTLVHNILFLRRIKETPSGKEWLVYRCQDTITDDEGNPRSNGYYMGFTTEQVPNVKRNALREIIDVTMDRERIVYNIPFSKEAVNEAISKSQNIPSDYAVAYASGFGPDPWRGNELTIWNLENFTDYPFDILEDANKRGYSRKDGTGIKDMLEENDADNTRLQESIKTMNVQKAKRDIQKAESYQRQEQQQQQQKK